MKKSLYFMNTKLLIACLLISSAVFGQTPPGYTKIGARYDWLAGKFDSSLHIPGYATTPNYRTGAWVGAGNIGVDTVNNRLYFYSNGWKYSNASSGGGVPTLQQSLDAGSLLTKTNSITIPDHDTLNIIGSQTPGDEGEVFRVNMPYHDGRIILNSDTSIASHWHGQLFLRSEDDPGGALYNLTARDESGNSTGIYGTFGSLTYSDSYGTLLSFSNGSTNFTPFLGGFYIDTLTNAPGVKALRYNPTTGLVSYADTATGGGSGVTTIGTINGQTKSANGSVISGSSLYMQTVNNTMPGMFSTGTDTSAGHKKFEGQISLIGIGLNRKMNFNAAGTYFIKDDTSGARLQVSANSLILTASGVGGSVTFSDGNVGVTGVINSSGNWSFGNYNDTYKIDASGTIRSTLSAYFATSSGGVAIGATSVNASAILDIVSTAKGFLPPRMTTTQKNAISSPAEGLVVYDLTLHKLCVYTGSAWETITSL